MSKTTPKKSTQERDNEQRTLTAVAQIQHEKIQALVAAVQKLSRKVTEVNDDIKMVIDNLSNKMSDLDEQLKEHLASVSQADVTEAPETVETTEAPVPAA